ncbi:CPBP family intramembrane metalloprotease domain-containing protein [Pseudoclavibacter sp. AY1F1]|uniref:CPBP family intramembrane glutamic endopeptidase n=1 Tax=Pseudoclavibacter sp. AY1F1 TaxID=2080583 RepID=UPI000CE8BB48|nr:type II CAAX endopeptidase family protein [Pseudoclavibacter sp. AY1F1]PPF41914.1 CPBP family intramembrane metalloprotease domain-containing protein [Pseudoclavibacter sp. AY1F1]
MTTAARGSRHLEALPEGVEYHRVLAGEKRRIGRGILAIALVIGGMFGSILVFHFLSIWIDGLVRPEATAPPGPFSPIAFATGALATALVGPWSMLIQRWLYRVPGRSLHSVVSRFRFAVFGRALLVVLPIVLIALTTTEFLQPGATAPWNNTDLILFFMAIMLLVPLQSAGEEYGIRGLIFRVAGSWVHGRWASLVLGIAVSTVVFTLIHGAGDPWWNVFYIVMSISAGLVTWRSGGIEIAVVIHAVYNVVTMLFWIVLHADLTERFDRSPGAVTPALLVPSAIAFIVIAAIVWLTTRRSGPLKTPPPSGQ